MHSMHIGILKMKTTSKIVVTILTKLKYSSHYYWRKSQIALNDNNYLSEGILEN